MTVDFNPHNLDPDAECHLVAHNTFIVDQTPSIRSALLRAVSLAETAPDDPVVVVSIYAPDADGEPSRLLVHTFNVPGDPSF